MRVEPSWMGLVPLKETRKLDLFPSCADPRRRQLFVTGKMALFRTVRYKYLLFKPFNPWQSVIAAQAKTAVQGSDPTGLKVWVRP